MMFKVYSAMVRGNEIALRNNRRSIRNRIVKSNVETLKGMKMDGK